MWFWRNKLNPDTYINLIQIVSQIKEKIKMQYEEWYCSSPTCEKKSHCESSDGAKEDGRFILRQYENKVLVLKSYKKWT